MERTLTRYGATGFAYGWQGQGEHQRASVEFVLRGWHVRLYVRPPEKHGYSKTLTGKTREPAVARAAYEQAMRQRWRAIVLIVKAKLEAVESGVFTFEEEWLPHMVLPSGQTYSEWAAPQLAEVYKGHAMPPLLPGLGETSASR